MQAHAESVWEKELYALMEGNLRFVAGVRSVENFVHPDKLKEFAIKKQAPQAVVVACSDSRVPVEVIFDCGIGELFVIRVAGNVIDDVNLGSIELAVQAFSTQLCIIMGHTGCGAVGAALAGNTDQLPHYTQRLLKKLQPAIERVHRGDYGDVSHSGRDNAVIEANLRVSAEAVREQSSFLKSCASKGIFHVQEAIYDLHTGKVRLVERLKGK